MSARPPIPPALLDVCPALIVGSLLVISATNRYPSTRLTVFALTWRRRWITSCNAIVKRSYICILDNVFVGIEQEVCGTCAVSGHSLQQGKLASIRRVRSTKES